MAHISKRLKGGLWPNDVFNLHSDFTACHSGGIAENIEMNTSWLPLQVKQLARAFLYAPVCSYLTFWGVPLHRWPMYQAHTLQGQETPAGGEIEPFGKPAHIPRTHAENRICVLRHSRAVLGRFVLYPYKVSRKHAGTLWNGSGCEIGLLLNLYFKLPWIHKPEPFFRIEKNWPAILQFSSDFRIGFWNELVFSNLNRNENALSRLCERARVIVVES